MANGIFGRFGDIFRDGLQGITPSWVRHIFLAEPAARLLRLDQDAAQRALLDKPGEATVQQKVVDVVLPQDVFLRRTIAIPPTALGRHHDIAALDLVRRTPFAPTEVHWALTDTREAKTTELIQWVIKKTDITRYRTNLASQGFLARRFLMGTDARQLTIADFTADLAPGARMWRRLNAGFVLLIIGFATAIWLQPAWQVRTEITRDQIVLERLRNQALDLRAEIQTRSEASVQRTTFVNSVVRRQRAVDALRQLTVALPDTVWLSDLIFTPAQITVNGETADSAANLVLKLTDSNLTYVPALTGSVSRTGDGNERFGINFTLREMGQ